MGNELEILGNRGSVELVDPDFLIILACKEMTTVCKDDFSALFDWQALVCNQFLVQNVHQADRVTETNDEVKTGRMEGNGMSLVLRCIAEL